MPNWYPGYNAQGYKVEPGPLLVNGGLITQPKAVTSPGTVASATKVTNTTGFDCMVYMVATGVGAAIGTVLVGSGTVTTSGVVAGSAIPLSVYVPSNSSITVSYLGTLAWNWLAV